MGLTEEQRNRSLKDQNAHLAINQVHLSKRVNELKLEFANMVSERDALEIVIQEIEANIKQKNDERSDDLNSLGEDLKLSKINLDTREEKISNNENRLSEDRSAFDNNLKDLHQKEQRAANLEKEISQRLNSMKASEQRTKDLEQQKSLEAQEITKKVEILNIEIESLKKAQTDLDIIKGNCIQLEKNTKSINDQLEDRLKIITQQQKYTDDKKEEIKALKIELEEKLKKSTEKDIQIKNQFNEIENQFNNVKIAWLRINKKIKDKQIEIDLKALKPKEVSPEDL